MDTYEGNNEDPLSLHWYAYCKGNPENASDPSGYGELADVLTTIFNGTKFVAARSLGA